MENKIKVGEFCRTKDGQIYKIEDGTEFYEDSVNVGIGIIPDVEGIWVDKEHFTYVDKREIVKHSSNLIDLIQCGDYVNGHLVIDIPGDESGAVYLEQITKGALIPTLKEDIQSIVTKEMMESISYKVTKM